MAKRIGRAKKKVVGLDKEPDDLDDMAELPLELQYSTRGAMFLLKDSGPLTNRFFIFSTESNLDLMCRYRNWSGDGTFSVAAKFFYQLYTIHVHLTPSADMSAKEKSKRTTTVPTVYILNNSKSRESYRDVLRELCLKRPEFCYRVVIPLCRQHISK